jgi:hypothetical protein
MIVLVAACTTGEDGRSVTSGTPRPPSIASTTVGSSLRVALTPAVFGFLESVEEDRGSLTVVTLSSGEAWPAAVMVSIQGDCPQLTGEVGDTGSCPVALAIRGTGEVSAIYVLGPPDSDGERLVQGIEGRLADDMLQLDGRLNIPIPDDPSRLGMGCALGVTVDELASAGLVSELAAVVDSDFNLVAVICPTSD